MHRGSDLGIIQEGKAHEAACWSCSFRISPSSSTKAHQACFRADVCSTGVILRMLVEHTSLLLRLTDGISSTQGNGDTLYSLRTGSGSMFLDGRRADVLLWLRFSVLLLALRTPTSGLSWPRHASRKVIAGAIFAFLFLENGIIHVNVVENRGQVLMTQ